MELKYGCARVIHGAKLWRRIQIEILERVGVLSVDVTIAERAGELLADMRRKGRAAAAEDVLIAATALVHTFAISSRFQGCRSKTGCNAKHSGTYIPRTLRRPDDFREYAPGRALQSG